MISKEEAKQKYANIINSNPLAVTIINELIEEYEQQVCENCRFYSVQSIVNPASISIACNLIKGLEPGLETNQFGCNKFQCK